MQTLRTRMTRIMRSPGTALGMFVALVAGTAALTLAPQAQGNRPSTPPQAQPVAAPAPVAAPVPSTPPDAHGVVLTGTLSQEKLVQGSNGAIALHLTAHAPAMGAAVAPQKASDLVVVLDRSGSMAAENKLPYAKEAVRSLVNNLRAEDRFALVTFDSTAVVHTELTPVTDAARAQILSRVQAIRPGASTNISDGLLKARALLQNGDGERTRKVLLLSDGEANMGIVDPKELAKIAASFAEHRAVLSAIGMGLGFNETLMASLADYGMGNYSYLEHLAKLGEILHKDLQDTRQVFAGASGLEITLGEGVTVTDVGGYPLDLTTRPGTARVITGQLLGGTPKHFVVTLSAPTQSLGTFALGEVTLHYTTHQGDSQVTLPRTNLQVAVVEPTRRDEALASVNPAAVRQLWEGNNLGRMQKEYSHWLRAGDKAKAEQTIQSYRAALKQVEADTGVSVDSPALQDSLSVLEEETKEAFSGSATQQEEKRNRAAKVRHSESLKKQRVQ